MKSPVASQKEPISKKGRTRGFSCSRFAHRRRSSPATENSLTPIGTRRLSTRFLNLCGTSSRTPPGSTASRSSWPSSDTSTTKNARAWYRRNPRGLRTLSMIFREPHVPQMPKEFALGTSRIAVQSVAAAVYLLLQVDMKITGEAGFFRDLQSLLYLNSVYYLLPQLQIDELQTGHDSLVNCAGHSCILSLAR